MKLRLSLVTNSALLRDFSTMITSSSCKGKICWPSRESTRPVLCPLGMVNVIRDSPLTTKGRLESVKGQIGVMIS